MKVYCITKENEVKATCESKGSYDEVIYCTVCEKELSRTTKITEALGHDWGEWKETTAATVDSEGLKTRTCKNDSSHKETASIDKLPYSILDGDGQTYIIESDKEIVVRANGTFSKFLSLKMDGKTIDTKYYTAISGSTIVTLKDTYLDTLDEGNHELTFVYTDGEIKTSLKIAKADGVVENPVNTNTQEDNNIVADIDTTETSTNETSSSPKTGDNITLWIGIMIFSIIGTIGVAVFIRKRD